MRPETFQAAVTMVEDNYGIEVTARASALWFAECQAYTDEVFLAGVRLMLREHKIPKVNLATLLEYIGRIEGAMAALPGPEEKVALLLKKLRRFNPDTGIVNMGTPGLIVAGQDTPSGFTPDELAVMEEFGGPYACWSWTDKDVHFNRRALVEAFGRVARAVEDRAALGAGEGRLRLVGGV